MTESTDQSRRPRLSSDALSIVVTVITVGLTILGTLVYTTARLEDRRGARIDDVQAQAQADRAAGQAESRQLRDEARADREHFQREILRLTAEQAKLAALVRPKQQPQ